MTYGIKLALQRTLWQSGILQEMIEEVEDIASIYKWKYSIEYTKFPGGNFSNKAHNKKVYGISFSPPDCETVSICFYPIAE